MRFKFSLKTTLVCGILAAGMVRASYWQYQRHEAKKIYIAELSRRLEQPIVPLPELIASLKNPLDKKEWDRLIHRRVSLQGSYDFSHEMILRNRRLEGFPGVFAITPLKIENSDQAILVNRGFVPLPKSSLELRKEYQREPKATLITLIKASVPQKFLAPQDPPTGKDLPWVDAWLRVDVEKISQQLPYSVLPIHLEIIESTESKGLEEKIVSAKSSREEMFFLPGKETTIRAPDDIPKLNYPVPVFDTVVPPGRHQGYIFEWGVMALVTILIGAVLQLKRH